MSVAIAQTEDARPTLVNAWLLWTAASAAIPAIGVLRAVLMERNFGQHVPGQVTVLVISILVLALAPAVIQGLVLRRLAPWMMLSIWIGASWISAIVAVFLVDALRQVGFGGELAFALARARTAAGQSSWMGWAWLHLIAHAAAVSLIWNVVPLLAFGWMAKRPMRAFLIATVVGACVAIVLYQLYPGFRQTSMVSFYSPIDTTRAQFSWTAIAEIAAAVAILGMVQGAVGGYGLVRMFASPVPVRTPAVARVAGLVALVLVVAHGARYVLGTYGYRTGFPDIRRAFSVPPATDRSQGAAILSFSEKVVLPGPAWYAAPSSDGRNVLVQMKDKTIRMITGERRFTQTQMSIGESARSMVFSPDGRHAAVNNQQGVRRGKGDFDFGRVLLLSLAADGYEEMRDFRNSEPNCAFSSTMTFSADGRLLWIACERSTSKPDDLLAVALRVSDLAVVQRRPAPAALAGRGPVSDIMSTADGTFVTLFDWPIRPHRIIVLDVNKPEPVFMSGDVAAEHATGFSGLHLSPDGALVTLANAALHAFKRDAYQMSGQFRTFDTRTGKVVADIARQSGEGDITQWIAAYDRGRARFVGIGTTAASKSGTLVIWDQRTGKELQSIATAAYRVGRFSLDGTVLVLLHRNEDALSFYRAAP